jgi:hypothetical protein
MKEAPRFVLTLALEVGEQSALGPHRFIPGKSYCLGWKVGWALWTSVTNFENDYVLQTRGMYIGINFVHEYPTSCNDILVLLQDLYMFRVPAVPIIRSTIVQLTVTGITYITLDRECMVTSTLKVVHNRAVCHITVVELEFQLNHGDVTNRPIMDNL